MQNFSWALFFRPGRHSSFHAVRGRSLSSFAAGAVLLAAIAAPEAGGQTVTVGSEPEAIALNSATNTLYVANGQSQSVTVINGNTNTVSATVPAGIGPAAIAVDSVTNKIYVVNADSATLTVIDGATNTATATLPLGPGPSAIAVNPATNTIYVTDGLASSLTVINGATNAVSTLNGVGFDPGALAVDSVTNTIYVCSSEFSTVAVINGATNAIKTLNVGLFPAAVAVDMVTDKIYVACEPVMVIDGVTNAITSIPGTISSNGFPTTVAVNPVTNTVYVANDATGSTPATQIGTVTVINGATNMMTGSVAVGNDPVALAVDTATNTVYAANQLSNNATEIDGATEAATTLSAGSVPTALVIDPATNQLFVANGASTTLTVAVGLPGSQLAPPTITTSPQNQSANAGQSVTFTAAASGAATSQWLFNGTAISGATNPSLTLNNVGASSAGTYTFVATNGGGSATAAATLTVAIPSAPAFTTQPVSQTVVSGTTVVFNSAASGSPTPTYQWKVNGTALSGATSARLVVAGAAAANAGSYTSVATNSQGSATSSPATLGFVATGNVGRLVNLSVNTTAGKTQVLTVGFVTGGAGTSGSQTLLLRATGPALAALGVQNVLADPTLTVLSGQTVVASNDNWGTPAGNQATVTAADNATGAFALTNPSSLDAALVDVLTAGGYTVQIGGNTAAPGTTLAEVYDDTAPNTYTLATPRLINLSSNNLIAANGSMTAGFVIGGTTAKTVLIRATGPALAGLGVQGTMPDPQLALHTTVNNQDTVLASNSGWGGDPQITAVDTAVGAFPLTNSASKDSVVLVTLAPGAYTAVASSVSGTAGVALIEVYEVP